MQLSFIKEKIPEKLFSSLKESGIENLNPVQEKSVEAGLLDLKNSFVVAAPTASGKTLVAELMMVKNILENKTKAIYIVPLRALASEKYESFKEKYSKLGLKVAISTGDLDSADSWLQDYDLVVLTSEKMDSLLRHKAGWVFNVGVVVVDEVHLINDADRGPTLEITITKLRQMNPKIKFLFLSATIKNAQDLAEWIGGKLVKSDWRPVKLHEGIYDGAAVRFLEKDGFPADGGELGIAEQTAEIKKQALIFSSTRRSAESIAERCGKVVKAHLSAEERKKLFELSEKIEKILDSPTKQCKRLAGCVKEGTAFHHAGLCLPYNALIYLSDGRIVEIGKIVNNDERTDVCSLNNKLNSSICPVKENHKINAPSAMIKLITRTGKDILLTKSHPLLTVKNSRPTWIKSEELKQGDFIATPIKLRINSKNINFYDLLPKSARAYKQFATINIIINRLLKKYKSIKKIENHFNIRNLSSYRKHKNIKLEILEKMASECKINIKNRIKIVSMEGSQGRCLNVPKQMHQDFFWAVGCVAGDGTLNKNSIRFFAEDLKLTKKFCQIFKDQFNIKPAIRRHNGLFCCDVNSTILAHVFVKYFGMFYGKKSYRIEIPNVSLSNKTLGKYLSGLFDCEANVNARNNAEGGPCIEFSTTSEKLAKQIHISLLRFGILSYKRNRKTKNRKTKHKNQIITTKYNTCRIFIYGKKNLKSFRRFVGFFDRRKSKLLESVIKKKFTENNQIDVIPCGFGNMIKNIRIKRGLALHLEKSVPATTMYRYENNTNPIEKTMIRKINKKLKIPLLNRIINSDIFWDKIISKRTVKFKDKFVFDFSTKNENFVSDGIFAHNTTKQRKLIEDSFKERLIKIISATPTLAAGVNLPAYRVVIRDSKRYYADYGYVYIPVLEYEQMRGRAGRPQFDKEGESILVAKNPAEAKEMYEKFILGETEEIYSKLAAEPILRMHALALVGSELVKTEKELEDFFSQTFYGFQFPNEAALGERIEKILQELAEWKFIIRIGKELRATRIGKRVAELYLDPETAHKFSSSLAQFDAKTFGLLHLISSSRELGQKLNVRQAEFADYSDLLARKEEELMVSPLDEWDSDYEFFLSEIKTAAMLEAWASELGENEMNEKFKVAPGELHGKVEIADWLLYSCGELALLLGKKESMAEIRKLRTRLKYGIKEELLPLVRLRGIGRVRARRLFSAGLKTILSLKKTPAETLGLILGEAVAADVKKQVEIAGEK